MKIYFQKRTDKLKENLFLKASFFSAISSAVKIIISLLIGKIIAIKSGASGMAIYGQLLNFVAIAVVLSGGAINEGITKYVSEFNVYKDNSLNKLLSTAIKILIYCSIFFGILIIIFSKTLTLVILHEIEYRSIFILFGITLFFYGFNNFLLSVLNGFKEYKKFSIINIFLNLTTLLITIVLIYFYGLYGALLGIVLNQSVIFIFTLFFLRNEKWLKINSFSNSFDNRIFKLLLQFGLLAVLTTAITPIVSIVIRNFIIERESLAAAGYFEFVTRISSAGLLFFTVTVSTYYLPRISELFDKTEILKEVKDTYKIILPITFSILSVVYIFRFFIIKTLASDDFLKAANLFIFILLGVFFRLIAQVSGFVLLAKSRIKTLLSLEIVFNILYLVSSYFLLNLYGLIGCGYAFALYNFIYAIFTILITYTFLKKSN